MDIVIGVGSLMVDPQMEVVYDSTPTIVEIEKHKQYWHIRFIDGDIIICRKGFAELEVTGHIK